MASFFAVTFYKKTLLFLPFPALSNDAFKATSKRWGTALLRATTPAARTLKHSQEIQHPSKWLQGCRKAMRCSSTYCTDWLGAVDAGAQTGVSSSNSNEERYLNSCNTEKLSLTYPEENSAPCDLQEAHWEGLQISKWQLHWTQGQLSSLISTEPGFHFQKSPLQSSS